MYERGIVGCRRRMNNPGKESTESEGYGHGGGQGRATLVQHKTLGGSGLHDDRRRFTDWMLPSILRTTLTDQMADRRPRTSQSHAKNCTHKFIDGDCSSKILPLVLFLPARFHMWYVCICMYLWHGHHDTVARAADGSAQHHPHRLAGAVGEEDVVRVGTVAVAALNEVAHLCLCCVCMIFRSHEWKPTEAVQGIIWRYI